MALENSKIDDRNHWNSDVRKTSELFSIKMEIYFLEQYLQEVQDYKKICQDLLLLPEEFLDKPRKLYEDLEKFFPSFENDINEALTSFHVLRPLPMKEVAKHVEAIKNNREDVEKKLEILKKVLKKVEEKPLSIDRQIIRFPTPTTMPPESLQPHVSQTMNLSLKRAPVDVEKIQRSMWELEEKLWKKILEERTAAYEKEETLLVIRSYYLEVLHNSRSPQLEVTSGRLFDVQKARTYYEPVQKRIAVVKKTTTSVDMQKNTVEDKKNQFGSSLRHLFSLPKKPSPASVAKERITATIRGDKKLSIEEDDFSPLREKAHGHIFKQFFQSKVASLLALGGIMTATASSALHQEHKVAMKTATPTPITKKIPLVQKEQTYVAKPSPIHEKAPAVQSQEMLTKKLHEAQNIHPLKGVWIGTVTSDDKIFVPFSLTQIAQKNPGLAKAMSTARLVTIESIYRQEGELKEVGGIFYENRNSSVRIPSIHEKLTTSIAVYVKVVHKDGSEKLFGIGTMDSPVDQKVETPQPVAQAFVPPKIVTSQEHKVTHPVHAKTAALEKIQASVAPVQKTSFLDKTKNLFNKLLKR